MRIHQWDSGEVSPALQAILTGLRALARRVAGIEAPEAAPEAFDAPLPEVGEPSVSQLLGFYALILERLTALQKTMVPEAPEVPAEGGAELPKAKPLDTRQDHLLRGTYRVLDGFTYFDEVLPEAATQARALLEAYFKTGLKLVDEPMLREAGKVQVIASDAAAGAAAGFFADRGMAPVITSLGQINAQLLDLLAPEASPTVIGSIQENAARTAAARSINTFLRNVEEFLPETSDNEPHRTLLLGKFLSLAEKTEARLDRTPAGTSSARAAAPPTAPSGTSTPSEPPTDT